MATTKKAPERNDTILALVDAPKVHFEPKEDSDLETTSDPNIDANNGRDWRATEKIGEANGKQATDDLGNIWYGLSTQFYTKPWFGSPVAHHRDGWLKASDQGLKWDLQAVGSDPGVPQESANDEFAKQLVDVYYPKWGTTIPHVDSYVRQVNPATNTADWFLTFPNGRSAYLTAFDKSALSSKEELTGPQEPADTTGGKKDLLGGSTPPPATAPKTGFLTTTNILLGVAIIGLFGLIMVLTLRKKTA